MSPDPDRLYQLLPAVIRTSDVAQGHPLRDLLRVIGEQVDLLDDDIRRMYDNLFIETCEPWVVPYLGDLVGALVLPLPAGGGPACDDDTMTRLLAPRRLVADTIRLRQRKGTRGVVDDLVLAVSGWPSKIEEHAGPPATVLVKSWRLPSWPLTRVRPDRVQRRTNSYTLSVLGNDAQLYQSMEADDGDPTAPASPGIPKPIPRTMPREKFEAIYGEGRNLCLYENETPIPVGRVALENLEDWLPEMTGDNVALDPELGRVMFRERYRLDRLTASYHYGFATDIGGGEYARPVPSPPVGASLFRRGHLTDRGLRLRDILRNDDSPFTAWMRTLIGAGVLASLPDDLAGLEQALCAELNRVIQAYALADGPLDWETHGDRFDEEAIHLLNSVPAGGRRIRLNRLLLEAVYPGAIARAWQRQVVQAPGERRAISEAIRAMQAQEHPPLHMVVELADSDLYVESIDVDLPASHTFELRAAEGCRPTIVLPERSADIDDLVISCGPGSRVILDGLMVASHAVRIAGQPSEVIVRHCTLVPGWELDEACQPCCGSEPSLVLTDIPFTELEAAEPAHPAGERMTTCIQVDRSILGTIIVQRDEVGAEPILLNIRDSIVDATDRDGDAIAAPNERIAAARLTISGSTVIGATRVHAIDLGENSIFLGLVEVARRQIGCLRYSYVPPLDETRTPPRHACQPDLAMAKAGEDVPGPEANRVAPVFMHKDLRYGRPDYCRLLDNADNDGDNCAIEIRTGADDQSEMGAYHHLSLAQRTATLTTAVSDYLPLGWRLRLKYET